MMSAQDVLAAFHDLHEAQYGRAIDNNYPIPVTPGDFLAMFEDEAELARQNQDIDAFEFGERRGYYKAASAMLRAVGVEPSYYWSRVMEQGEDGPDNCPICEKGLNMKQERSIQRLYDRDNTYLGSVWDSHISSMFFSWDGFPTHEVKTHYSFIEAVAYLTKEE